MGRNSDYKLRSIGWELTFACNMRCKHCGSSCGMPKPDELTTEEAIKLCNDLAELEPECVTLSGGEPFLRKDWHVIAERLRENNVLVNAISNGWLVDKDVVKKALEVGLSNICVSLDGLEKTHNYLRAKESFQRVMRALDVMQKMGLPSSVCTTLNKNNLDELPALYGLLVDRRIESWQLQLADPMGNLLAHTELVLEPDDIGRIIDFAYEVMKEGRIIVDIADNIGYFDNKTTEISKKSFLSAGCSRSDGVWKGCQAGKSVLGIRCNGDVVPCLSIREDRFIEGNVRKTSLFEIWTRSGAFAWNREMSQNNLTGFCKKCQYSSLCLAGCTTQKITINNDLYENGFCIYRVEVEKEIKRVRSVDDANRLVLEAGRFIRNEQFNIAEACLEKVLSIDPNNIEALDQLGFVKYSLEKYDESIKLNEQSLKLNPSNAYAHKGLGVCYAKTGRAEEGIKLLRKAVELADTDFMDPYYDLAVILDENNQTKEAIEVLNKGRAKSADFTMKSDELYNLLLAKTRR